MASDFIVVDANAIQNLFAGGGTAAWDQLLSSGKKVVLSSVVNEEIQGAPKSIQDPFNNWREANNIPIVEFEIEGIRFPEGHPRAGELTRDAGDKVLRALMDHGNNPVAVAAL